MGEPFWHHFGMPFSGIDFQQHFHRFGWLFNGFVWIVGWFPSVFLDVFLNDVNYLFIDLDRMVDGFNLFDIFLFV